MIIFHLHLQEYYTIQSKIVAREFLGHERKKMQGMWSRILGLSMSELRRDR